MSNPEGIKFGIYYLNVDRQAGRGFIKYSMRVLPGPWGVLLFLFIFSHFFI